MVGDWDLRVEGTTIFRFSIERTGSGGWQGRWSRPESFNSNGNAFANLRGPVKVTSSMAGNAVFELVELAFDDPRPGAVPDIFRFRLIGPDAVDMTYVGTQLLPYRLVRAAAGDALGNWDSGRIYRRAAPGARPPAAAPAAAAPAAPAAEPALATPAPTASVATEPAPGAQVPPAGSAPSPAPPQPRVIQPTNDGRIILGRQVQFLDLTPRETPAEGDDAEPATDAASAAEAEAQAVPTARPAAPAAAPATAAPSRPAPAPVAAPAPAPSAARAPAPAPAPSPAEPDQSQIDAGFLDNL